MTIDVWQESRCGTRASARFNIQSPLDIRRPFAGRTLKRRGRRAPIASYETASTAKEAFVSGQKKVICLRLFRLISLIFGYLAYSRLAVGGGAKRNGETARRGTAEGRMVQRLLFGLRNVVFAQWRQKRRCPRSRPTAYSQLAIGNQLTANFRHAITKN
jgi:hypothetical protein